MTGIKIDKAFSDFKNKQLNSLQEINNKLEKDNILLKGDINEYQKLYVQSLIDSGSLEYASGKVIINSDWIPNDFLLRQLTLGQGIYSGPTALYLWGLSDEFPYTVYMTFKMGYKLPRTYTEWSSNVSPRQVNKQYLKDQISELKVEGTEYRISLFSMEKTLVEILREPYVLDTNLVNTAYKRYLKIVNKDTNKLLRIAKEMRSINKVVNRLEPLL